MKTIRTLARNFEIKAAPNDSGEFSGYGSVFEVVDAYNEAVVAGAFANTLAQWAAKGKLPPMLWQHMSREPIGVWTRMVEDARGLYVEGRILLEAGAAERRAYEHLKAGSINGLSIGFIPLVEEWDKTTDLIRIKEIDLWEVSLVTFPANPAATVDEVKAALHSIRECERFLRDAGFSKGEAKRLLAGGWDALSDRRDAEATEDEGEAKAINELARRILAA